MNATHEPLLAVDGLTIDLTGPGGQPGLVQDVSFEVHAGESVALIGESGCGKTMTAMAVLGLLPAGFRVAGGSIRFQGRDLLACPERELRSVRGAAIGAVFQEPMSSLDPTMRVGDQIAEARRLHLGEARKVALRRARELLDRVGIPNAEKRLAAYPHELSGGMQQRVGIARALANDPAVLLMDEPMGALDAFTREQLQEILIDVWAASRKMVFFITHSVEEALFLATRLVVMSPSPGRVAHTYDDLPFSRRFLAERDARRIKSDPAFIALREEVLSIIHRREAPDA